MLESKNTSASKGKRTEEKVLQYLLKKKFSLISRNLEFVGIELDLLMFKDHYHIFEVKSLRLWDELSFRVSQKQKARLEYARHALQDQRGESVELHYAFVVQEEIQFFGAHDFI